MPLHKVQTVALVGNPNCGKTTLFNALTGSRYKVANYPGVTVEKKEASLEFKDGSVVTLFDLPGTYSLAGATLDEQIVTKFLDGKLVSSGTPDLIVAVLDATNLERNLFLVSELIDAGLPVIVAVNMMDAAKATGLKVFTELLSLHLHVPVVPIVAKTQSGLSDLKSLVQKALADRNVSDRKLAWLPKEHPARMAIEGQGPSAIRGLEPSTIATFGALRYAWIRDIVARSTNQESVQKSPLSERLDQLLTSKLYGLPIMVALFALIFQSIFLWAQIPMDLISGVIDGTNGWLKSVLPDGALTDLLTDGIVAGVGNVVVFVPQIAVLFFFIGLLEDCGYLARAAFLLDNFMRKVGLQGRAFIPLLSSFACAVPGILSTRTIPSRSDRLATIMIAPLMSCSARLPVYAVLIGAFIPATMVAGFISLQGLTLLAMYISGVLGACGVAFILKKTLLWREPSFFVMEMPPLRAPVLSVVLRGAYDSVVSFLKNATTIILACSIVIWFLASYPKPSPDYQGNPVEVSFAGLMGKAIEPAIKPLGFDWQIGVGIIASFPAREVFVTGLSTIYNVADDGEDHTSLIDHLKARNASGAFPTATALALMMFYVFACQCMSTLAVCKRETGSWSWTLGMLGYMTALAYLAAFVTYQVGSRLL